MIKFGLKIALVIISFNFIYGDLNNYGEYDVCVSKLEVIKDPKLKLTDVNYEIIYNETTKKQLLRSHINVLVTQLGPIMYKFKLLKWTGKRFESMLTMKSKNLCESKGHVNFFSRFFHFIDEKKCIIGKGSKQIPDVTLWDFASQYVGTKFFYGTYKADMKFYSKQGSLTYAIIIISIVKPGTCVPENLNKPSA